MWALESDNLGLDEKQFLVPQWSHLWNGTHKRPSQGLLWRGMRSVHTLPCPAQFSQYCCITVLTFGEISFQAYNTTQPNPTQLNTTWRTLCIYNFVSYLFYSSSNFRHFQKNDTDFSFTTSLLMAGSCFMGWECHHLSHKPYCWTYRWIPFFCCYYI